MKNQETRWKPHQCTKACEETGDGHLVREYRSSYSWNPRSRRFKHLRGQLKRTKFLGKFTLHVWFYSTDLLKSKVGWVCTEIVAKRRKLFLQRVGTLHRSNSSISFELKVAHDFHWILQLYISLDTSFVTVSNMLNPLCIFVSNQSKLSRLSSCYHQTNNKALFLSGTLIHGTSVQLLWCILLRDLGILPQSLSFSVSLSASSFFHGRLIPPFVGR